MKSLKMLAIIAIIAIPVLSLTGCFISQSNKEVRLRNQFSQKTNERTVFYDKMWKIISQKGQIAVKNDSSFRQNVNIIMEGRKDAPNLFMKWVTETNPNTNYSEVSTLYKDLSRAIESEREGFFDQEKVLQDIKLQHDNLLGTFPSSVIMGLLGRQPLEYKPITSDRTDQVIQSGKDNDVKLF